MYQFRELSAGAIIFLVFILVVELYFVYDASEEECAWKNIDKNGDGYISKSELKIYLDAIERGKNNKKVRKNELMKSVFGGAVRGFLMGFILGNLEGGLAMGLVLGCVNPLLTSTEKLLF
jgi:hypothetical protein